MPKKKKNDDDDFVPVDEPLDEEEFKIDENLVDESLIDELPKPEEEPLGDVVEDDDSLSGKKRKRSKTSKKQSGPKKKKRKKGKISKSLQALEKSQLIDIFSTLCDDDEQLETKISTLIPAPDMSKIKKELNVLRNKISRAFPYNKYGVRPSLSNFKKAYLGYIKNYKQAQNWRYLRTFLSETIELVGNLPSWDNEKHNASRKQIFKQIGTACKAMVKNRDNGFTKEDYEEIADELGSYVEYEGIGEVVKMCKDKMK